MAKTKKLSYNQTQLNPDAVFERHVYHRDQFAHYLRWTHVVKLAKIGQKVLDVGCGSGNMLEVFWRNRYKPGKFVGLDVRERTINLLNEEWKERVDFAEFQVCDVVNQAPPEDDWDIITCFEVLEHIGRQNGRRFLTNIKSVMKKKTRFLLSTPCYDPKVGAADNHIIEGEVGEWDYNELKTLLEELFQIEMVNGTFASKRDIYPALSSYERVVYDDLTKYYDSDLMAVIFAPLHPDKSRNAIWTLMIP